MNRFFLIAFISVVALSAGVIRAQEANEEINIPDAIMERIVRRIVNSHFRSSRGERTIYFSDKLIKAKWLPNIRNKKFIVLDNDEAARSGKEFHIFHDVDVAGDRFQVSFGSGTGCSLHGGIWSFKMIGNKLSVYRTNGGWGTGCGSSNGSVGCGGPPN